jgi:hypothetical protein
MELYIARASGESDTTMNYRLYDDGRHCYPHKSEKTECIGLIYWIDDTGNVRKIFSSQPNGVRTRGSHDLDGGCVFGQMLRREEIQI